MRLGVLATAISIVFALVSCRAIEHRGMYDSYSHATPGYGSHRHGIGRNDLREIYRGHITGYIDFNGRQHDRFRGCVPGMRLIIDETFTVTCREYKKVQAYRPPVSIVSNGYDNFMVYGNDHIRVSRY